MTAADLIDFVRTAAGQAMLAAGLMFVLIGAVGVLRFPDFYTRLHAAGVTDTLGADLMLFGLMLQADSIQTALKLGLISFFFFLAGPTATHALANAAYTAGLAPWRRRGSKAPGPQHGEAG